MHADPWAQMPAPWNPSICGARLLRMFGNVSHWMHRIGASVRQDPVRVVSDADAAARILSEHPGLKKVVLHRISRPAAGYVFRIPAKKGSRSSALPEPDAVYQT